MKRVLMVLGLAGLLSTGGLGFARSTAASDSCSYEFETCIGDAQEALSSCLDSAGTSPKKIAACITKFGLAQEICRADFTACEFLDR